MYLPSLLTIWWSLLPLYPLMLRTHVHKLSPHWDQEYHETGNLIHICVDVHMYVHVVCVRV